MPFDSSTPVPDFQRIQPSSTASSLEDLSRSSFPHVCLRSVPGPSDMPDATQNMSDRSLPISPYFHKHNFYPERRPGKGPQKITTVLDRVYAISSTKMVEEFQRQKKEKIRQDEEKQKKQLEKKNRQRNITGTKRKSQMSRQPKKSCPPLVTKDRQH